MFCYQCEQTANGTGCTKMGVCGKDADVASLQDLLVHATKGLAMVAHRARGVGVVDRRADVTIVEALFSTVTNVNFDPDRLARLVTCVVQLRDELLTAYQSACNKAGSKADAPAGPAELAPAGDRDGLVAQGREVGVAPRREALGEDMAGVQELLLYGLKGMAAYADHAQILGWEDDGVYAFFHEALNFLTTDDAADIDKLLPMVLRCGEVNLKVMGLLDSANTGAYGDPQPTGVRITPVAGKAILVSGHDLKDLHDLLVQTEGRGVNVYTHGEMLPAHGYPGLKKFPHLVGNYGGAWQDQKAEFAAFPGAILMTTNCIQKPAEDYKKRIFTSGLVAWPGAGHIADGNFEQVIEAALAAEGFAEDAQEKSITVGFGHAAVMSVADAVIAAVKEGKIRHFFLVGGCDGAKSGRNYYTRFAQLVGDDCVILTLGCGKYRFNKLDLSGRPAGFGDIGGIPRLLDIGQCNDAYSAIQIAVALAKAFDCGVNDLPLSIVLSWYEQKAVCILLTLLHLGVRNIRLGPSLPAFVSPAVLKVLVDKFNIAPITTPEEDLEALLS